MLFIGVERLKTDKLRRVIVVMKIETALREGDAARRDEPRPRANLGRREVHVGGKAYFYSQSQHVERCIRST